MNNILMKNKIVLFAEDDEIIKKNITEVLEMIFKKVYTASNGQDAYELYCEEQIDIIITDIKMPILDGLKLTEKIRINDYETPIILLTNFCEQEFLLKAVNLSIDAYITKPIELCTLINSIHKSMQRVIKKRGKIFLSKDIYYHVDNQEIYKNNKIVHLGNKELELLQLLINNDTRTVTKNEISEFLWPLESVCNSSIKNLILRIRKKLNEDIITSVRGVGYRLNIKEHS